MKNILFRFAALLSLTLLLGMVAAAQTQKSDTEDSNDDSPTVAVIKGTGKVAAVVVGSVAKATWATTKFAAKNVAKPVGKAVFVKAAPSAGKFALKKSLKHLVPLAIKLSIL